MKKILFFLLFCPVWAMAGQVNPIPVFGLNSTSTATTLYDFQSTTSMRINKYGAADVFELYRLVGTTFEGTIIDQNFWAPVYSTGCTIT